MNNEQVAIAKTPAADIPPEKLFVSVPLAARMTSGVQNVKDMILMQREIVAAQAASTPPGEPRPPEARVKEMNNSGGLGMGFSPQLVIPEGETEVLRRRLARGRGGGR